MNTGIRVLLIITLGTFGYTDVQAQSLDLFQATDNPETNEANAGRRPQQRNTATNSDPAFTLVGTSRFGDEFHASLLSRAGESVKVEWTPGRVREIDGHRGFAVANIGSRTVSVRYPETEPCIDNTEKGVMCNGNMAVLTLSNAKPIERIRTEAANVVIINNEEGEPVELNEEGEPLTIGNTGVLTRNPFSGELQSAPELTPEEIAAREERRQRRAEQFRNFEIVRIPDDEIPEGMQRIRTPFGDRLEPSED